MVKPYQTKPGFLYIPCKRGDGILAPSKEEQFRIRNGMCGGYIDPEDWVTPPILSRYTQGETLWIEIPKTKQNKDFCIAAGLPINNTSDSSTPGKNYRRMANFIDFSQLPAHVPDFYTDVYEHKKPIPVMALQSIPIESIKNTSLLTVNGKDLIPDVGQITQGNYTVGAGAGDDYPTYGGAGGAYAALGNLTGDLSFTTNSAITETATAMATINLNSFTLLNTAALLHLLNTLSGYVVSANFQGIIFDVECEGPGNYIHRNQHVKYLSANAATNISFYVANIVTACNIILNDLLLDGNGRRGEYGIRINDNTPTLFVYNTTMWEMDIRGIYAAAVNANSVFENITCYNTPGIGFHLVNQNATMINCAGYANGTDFSGTGSATGINNVSDDATAANGNWNSGTENQINGTPANDFESVSDAGGANFLLPKTTGLLYGKGASPTIAGHTHYGNGVAIVTGDVDIGAKGILRASSSAHKSKTSISTSMGI